MKLKDLITKQGTEKGFSLIELLVALAIMAVLVVVVAPSLLSNTEKSRARKDLSAMDEVRHAVETSIVDREIYSELLKYSVDDNVSCYIDTETEAESSSHSLITATYTNGKHDEYTFGANARLADEVRYSLAGTMHGVTITLIPTPGGSSNSSLYYLEDAIINKYYDSLGTESAFLTEADLLYNQLCSICGDYITIDSQTYRNSEYTIFIPMQSVAWGEVWDAEPVHPYGQWNGTNLPADIQDSPVAPDRQEPIIPEEPDPVPDIPEPGPEEPDPIPVPDPIPTPEPAERSVKLTTGSRINQVLRQYPNVQKIIFTKNESASDGVDVSEAKDGGVLAWFRNGTVYFSTGRNLNIEANENMEFIFSGLPVLESVSFGGNLDTTKTDTMQSMFNGCSLLTDVDLNKLNTNNVTLMNSMFSGCGNMTVFDLSTFNTSKVTNFASMFENCHKVVDLNLGTFNTQSAYSMSEMFSGCANLKSLNVTSFNTANVVDFRRMFNGCVNIDFLNLESFDTRKAENMGRMFYNCIRLKKVTLGENFTFNGKTATRLTDLPVPNPAYIDGCDGRWYNMITKVPYEAKDVPNKVAATYVATSFDIEDDTVIPEDLSVKLAPGSTVMTAIHNSTQYVVFTDGACKIDVPTTDVSAAQDGGVVAWTNVVSYRGTTEVYCFISTQRPGVKIVANEDCSYMFFDKKNLKEVEFSNLDTSLVENMNSMLALSSPGQAKLETLSFENFDTSKVTSMNGLLKNQTSLQSVDISMLRTDSLTKMNELFYNCYELKELDLSNFNTNKVKQNVDAFSGCRKLQEVTIGENFSFKGDGTAGCLLPRPSSTYIPRANGYWYNELIGERYLPEEIPNKKVATYTAIPIPSTILLAGEDFEELIPERTTKIIFTDINSHPNAVLTDVSLDQDGGVVAWMDGTEMYVSTRRSGVIIRANEDCSKMFYGRNLISAIEFNNITTRETKKMSSMFEGCSSLAELKLNVFDVTKVTTMDSMFKGCTLLETIQMNEWDVASIVDLGQMFKDCATIKELDFSNFVLYNVTDVAAMFENCVSVTSVSFGDTLYNDADDTRLWKIQSIERIFNGCSNLRDVNLSRFDTRNVINMSSAFEKCTALTELDLTVFETSMVNNYDRMFADCMALGTIWISSLWDEVYDPVNETSTDMFIGCTAPLYGRDSTVAYEAEANNGMMANHTDGYLSYKELSTMIVPGDMFNVLAHDYYKHSFVDDKYAVVFTHERPDRSIYLQDVSANRDNGVVAWEGERIFNGAVQPTLFVSTRREAYMPQANFDASNMFKNKDFTIVDCSFFATDQMTKSSSMFENLDNVIELDLLYFDTRECTEMTAMFDGMVKMNKIRLGDKFTFDGNSGGRLCDLPTPNPDYISGADGKWHDMANGDEFLGNAIPNLKEATYTAQPHTIVYTITYDLEGGIQSSAVPVVNPANPTEFTMRSASITLNNPTRTGYKFLGWTGSNGDTPEMTITIPTGSKRHRIYVANWEKQAVTYKVQHFLMLVDGTYSSTPDTTETFTALADDLVTPAVQEHIGFTSPDQQLTQVLPDGSTIVKYKYERNKYQLILTRDSNIESADGAGFYFYQSTVSVSATPKPGYKFKDWTGDFTSNDANMSFEMPARDVSVQANTDIIVYSLTYDLYGNATSTSTQPVLGTPNPTTYTVETPSFTLNNPTRVGYTFAGWVGYNGDTPNPNLTIELGSIDNRTYSASWTPRTDTKYTVLHYKQDWNDPSKYDLALKEELYGTTDSYVTPARKNYDGFASPAGQQKQILADGSQVFEYKYNRNKYTVKITAGSGILSTSINGVKTTSADVTCGSSVTINCVVSDGYLWQKWTGYTTTTTQAYTFTMPTQDVTFNVSGYREPVAYLYTDGTMEFLPYPSAKTSGKTISKTWYGASTWSVRTYDRDVSPWASAGSSVRNAIKSVTYKKWCWPYSTYENFHGDANSREGSVSTLWPNLKTAVFEDYSMRNNTLGHGTFYDAWYLSTVNMSHTVTSWESHAFQRTRYLSKIRIPKDLTSIPNETFKLNWQTSSQVPPKVVSFGGSSWYNMYVLTNMNVPATLKTVGDYGFRTTSKLSTVYFGGSSKSQVSIPNTGKSTDANYYFYAANWICNTYTYNP